MINELVDYAYRGAFAEVPVESPDVMPLLPRDLKREVTMDVRRPLPYV